MTQCKQKISKSGNKSYREFQDWNHKIFVIHTIYYNIQKTVVQQSISFCDLLFIFIDWHLVFARKKKERCRWFERQKIRFLCLYQKYFKSFTIRTVKRVDRTGFIVWSLLLKYFYFEWLGTVQHQLLLLGIDMRIISWSFYIFEGSFYIFEETFLVNWFSWSILLYS